MIDINLIRENPELVKENIRKKFQDEKLPLVDEVAAMDKEVREVKQKGDALRADRNKMSKQIGGLMREGKKDEAEQIKVKVKSMGSDIRASFKNGVLSVEIPEVKEVEDKPEEKYIAIE